MHFALVICDGPYIDAALGEPSYSAWRYGGHGLRARAEPLTALLLDDVKRRRWPSASHRSILRSACASDLAALEPMGPMR